MSTESEQDLDETRRLLYMALLADSEHPELYASLVNALAHHSGLASSEEATQHLLDDDVEWIKDRIWVITQTLSAAGGS